ncbi:hypothetical protein [Dactylosporangium fulvum]|uniref:Uncharacterized protein n=1 Tax=Dactylosporangium fulvum TaxID=53359 RepID=A0ABY5W9V5_9ACTN|nr:hypothetical protein [Dactylosporangium fulvum]UWP85799.1 hypothetical protein Dfulv_16765 [Dactylosporangium fulvum]
MTTAVTDGLLARLADDPLLELRMAAIKVRSRAEVALREFTTGENFSYTDDWGRACDNMLGGEIGDYLAAFSPYAGLELAGWLESVVKRLERQVPGQEARGEGPVALADKAAAFTIARALLGRRP